MISAEGVRSDPHKIRAVEQWPFPAKVLDGRSFLGLALYYHRFIGDFVEIAVPFHHLTAKSTEGSGGVQSVTVFHTLKKKLVTASVIAVSCGDVPFIVDCDASD